MCCTTILGTGETKVTKTPKTKRRPYESSVLGYCCAQNLLIEYFLFLALNTHESCFLFLATYQAQSADSEQELQPRCCSNWRRCPCSPSARCPRGSVCPGSSGGAQSGCAQGGPLPLELSGPPVPPGTRAENSLALRAAMVERMEALVCVQLWVNFQHNYVNWASVHCMGPSIARDYTYKAATNSQIDSQPGRALS